MPTGRQGNLIVQSTKTVKDSEMRGKLIEEIKKAGKPYGLYFEDVQGGFTLTTRELPQAFQVLPVIVWRVYAGRAAGSTGARRGYRGHSAGIPESNPADGRHNAGFQRNLRSGIRQRSGFRIGAGHAVQRNGSAKAHGVARAASDPAGSRIR